MKKKILIFIAIFPLFPLFSQINLINDGIFEETSLFADKTITVFPENKGEWFPYIAKSESVNITTSADEHQGTVVNIQTNSTPAKYSFVGQRIEWTPVPAIYTLAFSAKTLETNAKPIVNVYLKVKSDNQHEETYFRISSAKDQLDESACQYVKSFRLNNFWEYYVVNFDLSKIIKISSNELSKSHLCDASDDERNDFYIAFSCAEVNTRVRITEVSLSLAKE